MSVGPIRFVVFGDATLDVTVHGSAPSGHGSDRPARITLGPGGQGANMAVRLARRGARVTLVTALADDVAGEQLAGFLAADEVIVVALAADRTGTVVSLVDATGERAMLSDRASLDAAGLRSPSVRSATDEAGWIHVSGYPLADAASGAALAAMLSSRRAEQGCSVGGGSFVASREMQDRLLTRLRTIRPELVLFDRAEASVLLGREPAARRASAESPSAESPSAEGLAAELASALGGTAVVTDGAAGAAAATPAGSVMVPGLPGAALDATGAGDAFGAGFLLALAGGPWPPLLPAVRDALERGSGLGAEVAGVVGAQARLPSEA